MAYSRQSWAQSHGDQQQLLVDVGPARWASQKIMSSSQRLNSSVSPPTLLTSLPQQSISQVKEQIEDIIASYWGDSEEEDDDDAETTRTVSVSL